MGRFENLKLRVGDLVKYKKEAHLYRAQRRQIRASSYPILVVESITIWTNYHTNEIDEISVVLVASDGSKFIEWTEHLAYLDGTEIT